MASPSPNDLTRQQLDELDALLQRMLALPVSQPEPALAYPPPPPLPELNPTHPEPEPAVVSWRADAPVTSKAPHLSPAPEPAVSFSPATTLPFPPISRGKPDPSPRPAPAPEPPAPRLFPLPEPPAEMVGDTGTLRGVDAPALPLNYRPVEPAPTPAVEFPEVNPFAEPLSPVVQERPTPAARPVPVLMWPVFALNWVIEFVLGWFGPVGQVMLRPVGKTLLGWLGVLLLVAAGVWTARGMGWISWPR